MTSAPRTGRLTRGAIVGLAVAQAAAARLGHKVQTLAVAEAQREAARSAHEAELGRILFSALNQLKGTALKASQLLSLEMGLLPEGVRQELARAHYQVTPLNRALVIKLLRQEFGRGPEELFRDFEPQAFAAASLGQVHAATLHDGQCVAVKLQYPGMAASIRSDMRLLRTLLAGLGASTELLPDAALRDRLLDGIERKLAEELDYRQEADALDWFAERLPARVPGLLVPRAVRALSSARVLTAPRVPGLHLVEWLATSPTQAQRNRFGQLLWDGFLCSVFELHHLHADPHPGNYLFLPDGQLGLLDFGCTQSLPPGFCEALGAAWSALLRGETQGVQQAYTRLGLVSPDLDAQAFEQTLLPALAGLLDWQLLPLRQPTYDFSRHPAPPRLGAQQHRQAMKHLHSMPAELPYFDRAYLGLTQLLRSLGAQVRTANPWIQ
jgi:predicted unusual protein kinase regulating ubiquinone biosynthesis (AarF/ABC1/UbiB family)